MTPSGAVSLREEKEGLLCALHKARQALTCLPLWVRKGVKQNMVYSEADACLRFRFISSSADAVLPLCVTVAALVVAAFVVAALVQAL